VGGFFLFGGGGCSIFSGGFFLVFSLPLYTILTTGAAQELKPPFCEASFSPNLDLPTFLSTFPCALICKFFEG